MGEMLKRLAVVVALLTACAAEPKPVAEPRASANPLSDVPLGSSASEPDGGSDIPLGVRVSQPDAGNDIPLGAGRREGIMEFGVIQHDGDADDIEELYLMSGLACGRWLRVIKVVPQP